MHGGFGAGGGACEVYAAQEASSRVDMHRTALRQPAAAFCRILCTRNFQYVLCVLLAQHQRPRSPFVCKALSFMTIYYNPTDGVFVSAVLAAPSVCRSRRV
jgi:hypothetical protein